MIIFSWIIGIIGALGVAGTIAAVILFPAVVIPLLESIVAFILKCKPCLFAIAFVVACSASWWHGHHTAAVACRESELAAELRNKQIDLDNAKKAKDDETERANTIEAGANDQHTKDAAYIEELKNRPDPTCVLDDIDLGGVPNRRHWPRRAKPPASAR
jgi:hypothetical protein